MPLESVRGNSTQTVESKQKKAGRCGVLSGVLSGAAQYRLVCNGLGHCPFENRAGQIVHVR